MKGNEYFTTDECQSPHPRLHLTDGKVFVYVYRWLCAVWYVPPDAMTVPLPPQAPPLQTASSPINTPPFIHSFIHNYATLAPSHSPSSHYLSVSLIPFQPLFIFQPISRTQSYFSAFLIPTLLLPILPSLPHTVSHPPSLTQFLTMPPSHVFGFTVY